MRIFKKVSAVAFFVAALCLARPIAVHAATSPTLGESAVYSILGSSAVTNTGPTTTNGAVGVSPGTSITGFPPGQAGTSGTHSNDASAIAAQADDVSVFSTLNQTCDSSYGSGQDLTLLSPLGPGVYCSAGSFLLTGNLTLTGTGSGVYIFKSVSTVITSSSSSVTGGDPCKVWWRVGSSATLGTSTSFIGNIFALTSVTLNTSATLNGRALVQTGAVTLDSNTITSGCLSSSSLLSTISPAASTSQPGTGGPCLTSAINTVPVILESRRTSPTSIFLSWGPFAGINTFNVRYGLTNGNWQYNTNVTGFSATINDLPPNQPIWVEVAARNNCAIGTYSEARLVGGPALPNTGFNPSPKDSLNNTFFNITAAVGVAVLILTCLIVKNMCVQKTNRD